MLVKIQFWAMCRSVELQFGTRPALPFQFLKKRTVKRGVLKCEEPGLELGWGFFQTKFKSLNQNRKVLFKFVLKQLESSNQRFS